MIFRSVFDTSRDESFKMLNCAYPPAILCGNNLIYLFALYLEFPFQKRKKLLTSLRYQAVDTDAHLSIHSVATTGRNARLRSLLSRMTSLIRRSHTYLIFMSQIPGFQNLPDVDKEALAGSEFFTARKRNCGEVMFLHLSVILFTERGLRPWGLCLGRVSVQGRSLSREGLCPGRVCHGDLPYGKERAVRILLECILVKKC